jgi:ribonuclease HII
LELELGLWKAGVTLVAGLDEAGRGALAGPVVAAAVVLPTNQRQLEDGLTGVLDSKKLSHPQRLEAMRQIRGTALAWSAGAASHHEIDALGLLPATRLAMTRALSRLRLQPAHLLIDYLLLPEDERPQTSLAYGEDRSLSIAAASIVAKVTRDRWMSALSASYPGYELGRHKGYATELHRQALQRLGPSPVHRTSYAPVAQRVAAVDEPGRRTQPNPLLP